MKKTLALFLSAAWMLMLLSGCVGTTVVIGECDHVSPSPSTEPSAPESSAPLAEGALKTGLAVVTSVSDTHSAADGEQGEVKYDITLAAVTVDADGVIRDCVIDAVPATVAFDAQGVILTDLTAVPATKCELGENYGMVAWGGAIAEWDEQVAALAKFAVGKTVDELKNGAIDESGKAPAGTDLASSATIYLGGYVSAIEAAAAAARDLGAQTGDTLVLTTLNDLTASVSATADSEGTAQLDSSIVVLTHRDGVITSCYLDAVQAKIGFDAAGQVTSDLTAPIRTKNELGADYGMVAWAGAIAEWDQQAASFAQYVTGKTAEEVAGIAVTETTKPADGTDLSSSVTIAVGGFQALVAKALAQG